MFPLVVAAGCDDDSDPFSGYTEVGGLSDPIYVAVVAAVDEDTSAAPGEQDLTSLSDPGTVATASVSPVIVPVGYSAYASGSDERVSVVVTVLSDFVAEIDRVDLQVAVGSGETIESIELERDALSPDRFFTFLKPSCASELRGEDGVCQVESPIPCTVSPGGEETSETGRCDEFSFRLWRAVEEDATETEGSAARAPAPRLWTQVMSGEAR